MKKVPYVLLLVISGIYLLNPGFGIFELIPDQLPVIGHLDEGFFVLLFVYSLKHLGVSVPFLEKLSNRHDV